MAETKKPKKIKKDNLKKKGYKLSKADLPKQSTSFFESEGTPPADAYKKAQQAEALFQKTPFVDLAPESAGIAVPEVKIPPTNTVSAEPPVIQENTQIIEAPSPQYLAPSFQRGSRVTKAFRQARQSLLGSKVASPIDEALRKQLIPFTTKASVTKKFIEDNVTALQELSKTNQSVADILKHVEDPKYQKSIQNIFDKLTSNEEIFPEEMKEVISYFENVAAGLENVGVELSYSLPDLIKTVQDVIKDDKADFKTKRDSLNNLIKILDAQKIQNETTKSLKKLASEQLNFSQDQINQLSSLSNTLLEGEDVKDKKLIGTFSELNKKVGSLLLNIKEWREFAETPGDTDISNKESLLSKGLGAIDSGVKTGLIDTAFAALGLGGLGKVLSGLGVSFASLQALAGTLVTGFSQLLVPVLVFGTAIYGAVKGIMGTLDEWKKFGIGLIDFGKALFHYVDGIVDSFAKASPILEKLVEGIESIVNFLFDYLNPVNLLKTVGKGWEQIFGFAGLGAGKAGEALEDFSKKLNSLPEKGTTPQVSETVQAQVNSAIKQNPNLNQVSNAQSSINTVTGETSAIGFVPQNFSSPIAAKTSANPVALSSEAQSLAVKQHGEDRVAQQKMMQSSSQPIIIQQPAPPPPPQPGVRKNLIDDLSLAITNGSLLYR